MLSVPISRGSRRAPTLVRRKPRKSPPIVRLVSFQVYLKDCRNRPDEPVSIILHHDPGTGSKLIDSEGLLLIRRSIGTPEMIPITPSICLDDSELEERFICSPGPGDQKVNKVATAVQLRFDVGRSPSMPVLVKRRLIRLAGRRVSNASILTIEAHRFRIRERNREDALERLVERYARLVINQSRVRKPNDADSERT